MSRTTTTTMNHPNPNNSSLPPSMIRRDQRPSNTTTRQRRGNTAGRACDGGAGHSSGGEEDALSLSPIKSLSETLKEMNGGRAGGRAGGGAYSQQAATAHAQTFPNRLPGKMSPNRGENGDEHRPLMDAYGDGGDDGGTHYSEYDDGGYSVYSTDSTFSTSLGPWAVPLDWTASVLYRYAGFDLRACLARWGYNARMIRRVLLPRLCKGMAVLIFLSFVLSHGSGSDDDVEDSIAVVKKANIRSSNGKNIANFDAMKDMKKSDAKKPKAAKQDSIADKIAATAAAKEGGNSKDGSKDDSESNLNGDNDKSEKKKKKEKTKLPIPNALGNLSDLNVPYDAGTETPYFWDVHFAGETIAERVFSKCHGLAQAAEHGLQQPDFNEDELAVFDLDGDKFVNVDLSLEAGIDRAARIDLVGSRLADVIISPDLPQVAKVFSDRNRGRMFAIFRHPVDRAVSMYYYLSTATWDPMYNPNLKEMSLQEYAKSSSVENNWLTRFLVGKKSGALGREHMVLAKKIVRNKILVGLYTDIDTSLSRFDRYFGWTDNAREKAGELRTRQEMDEQADKCRAAFVAAGDDRHNHPTIEPQSKEWDLIIRQNKYDMELYEYIEKLYKTQAEQIFGVK